MVTTKSSPENASSSTWFQKAVIVAVLAVIVGYAVILHQKNVVLEKSMTDYTRELNAVKVDLESWRSEKQNLMAKLDKTTEFTDEESIAILKESLEYYRSELDAIKKELQSLRSEKQALMAKLNETTKGSIAFNKILVLENSLANHSMKLNFVKNELESLRSEKQILKETFIYETKRYEDLSKVHYNTLLSKLDEVSNMNEDKLDKRIGGIEKLFNHSNDEHARELRKFQQSIDNIYHSSNKATKDIEVLQIKIEKVSSIVVSSGNTIAFYAFMGSSVDPGIHQPIIFNHVVTNVGGAYNGQNGKFTAPSDGVYVFAWVLFSYEGGYLRSALVINNAVYGHVDTDSGSGRNFISATGVVVAQVKQGDTVYVRTDSKAGGILSTGDKRTQFSGWRLN